MKKIAVILVFCIAFLSQTKANEDVQRLIKEGIELHGEGEYQQAIERYNEALQLDPANILAIYEMSLSYLAMGDYENAIKFSTQVIESDDQTLTIGAYAIKSEALYALDRVDEAIKLLENALERHENEYLLHFNLALKHYRKNNLYHTLFHVRRAIDIDKSHSEAFLLYAYALNDSGLWLSSIFAFQIFLLLEPDSRRSVSAFEELLRTMRISTSSEEGVERSFIQQPAGRDQSPSGYMISPTEIPPLGIENGINRFLIFSAITVALDSLTAASLDDDLFTVFKTVNREIITLLDAENDGSEERMCKFWTFYVPFFAHIVRSEHYETFCRYISVSYLPESFEWWQDNPEYAENFVLWFSEGDEEIEKDVIDSDLSATEAIHEQ